MTVQEVVATRKLLLRRWVAAWVDFCASFGILVVGELLVGIEVYQSTLAFWLLLALAYFPILEGFTGRTLGRLVTRTVVVDSNGNLPGARRALLRTIARLIEVNPVLLGGIPAGIVVLTNHHHQRLGDMWAGTYVVREGELQAVRASAPLAFAPVG
jgi:uncharacterized RDD family membrane protein YckC